MNKDIFNFGKQALADELKKDAENNNKNGIWIYLQIQTISNKKFAELPEKQADELLSLMNDVAYGFVGFLDEKFANGFPASFDLYYVCRNAVSELTNENDLEKEDTLFTKMLMAAVAAAFRMWFDKISNADIIAFIEDKPHRELPDLTDASTTFAWAVQQNIPCSDIDGLFDHSSDEKKDEAREKQVDKMIEDVKNTFDTIIPYIVKDGVPQTFIDNNLEACRKMFLFANMLYLTMPVVIDAEKLVNDDKTINWIFESFADDIIEQEVKNCLKDKNNKSYLQKVFKYSFIVSQHQESHGGHDRATVYKALAMKKSKKSK